jgi:HlyD family secretion protein
MKKSLNLLALLIIIFSIGLSACSTLNGANTTELKASGTISAREVDIAPQVGGQVVSVSFEEGAQVKAGDELFRLDDSLLRAQLNVAAAGVETAQAAVVMAEAGLAAAQAQYEATLSSAYLQDSWKSANLWQMSVPEEINLPAWYFQKYEYLDAAIVEEQAALQAVEREQANLDRVLADASNDDFIAAEKDLVEKRAYYLSLKATRDQAESAQEGDEIRSAADELYNAALTDLEAAELAYNRMINSEAAKRVREARARLAVVQARLDYARSVKAQMQTGDDSLQVKAVQDQVRQAENAVSQAQAGLKQAQANLELIDAQIAKTIIVAPTDGILLIRSLEVGETVAPAGVVMVIGQLEEVELVVYIPETEYGKVQLGDQVAIAVDSFPNETFTGTVAHISDKAEFTPRNVQTVEGRQATVYAIKLTVPNPNLKLKPGMPADVTFK